MKIELYGLTPPVSVLTSDVNADADAPSNNDNNSSSSSSGSSSSSSCSSSSNSSSSKNISLSSIESIVPTTSTTSPRVHGTSNLYLHHVYRRRWSTLRLHNSQGIAPMMALLVYYIYKLMYYITHDFSWLDVLNLSRTSIAMIPGVIYSTCSFITMPTVIVHVQMIYNAIKRQFYHYVESWQYTWSVLVMEREEIIDVHETEIIDLLISTAIIIILIMLIRRARDPPPPVA